MKIINKIPFFFYLLIVYNAVAFSSAEGNNFEGMLFEFQLVSSAVVQVSLNTLFIIIGLHCMYFEILRSVRSSVTTIINHTLSLVIFIVFLIEFIVVKQAGTAAFMVMTTMSLFVVIAGFTVSLSTARRDVFVDR